MGFVEDLKDTAPRNIGEVVNPYYQVKALGRYGQTGERRKAESERQKREEEARNKAAQEGYMSDLEKKGEGYFTGEKQRAGSGECACIPEKEGASGEGERRGNRTRRGEAEDPGCDVDGPCVCRGCREGERAWPGFGEAEGGTAVEEGA